MANGSSNPKEHAHELIDRMAPCQVAALVSLLETMLDPVARSLANAPFEDEPIGEEEARTVAASKAWLRQNQPISNEEVVEYGPTSALDLKRINDAADKLNLESAEVLKFQSLRS